MFDWVFTIHGWTALVTLTALEVVLGIDNVIFISVLVGRLPEEVRDRARSIGIFMAMFVRLLLLSMLFWLAHLSVEAFAVFGHAFSLRDLVLIAGGLFLLWKSTVEIHHNVEGDGHHESSAAGATFTGVIIQIMVIDVVFSLDSVITAIGMADHMSVMAIAIIIAVFFMLMFSGMVSRFIERHPTVKVLALSFLLMVGLALVADGFGMHIPKGYIYFAMAFSVFVEALNIRVRDRARARSNTGRSE